MAGIQKSLKKFKPKIDCIKRAIRKFWYMNSIQETKPYEIVYQPFFVDVNIEN